MSCGESPFSMPNKGMQEMKVYGERVVLSFSGEDAVVERIGMGRRW